MTRPSDRVTILFSTSSFVTCAVVHMCTFFRSATWGVSGSPPVTPSAALPCPVVKAVIICRP